MSTEDDLFDSNPNPSGSDSLDCVDLIIDGPGDNTIRPATGKARERLIAEREKIRRWQKELDEA